MSSGAMFAEECVAVALVYGINISMKKKIVNCYEMVQLHLEKDGRAIDEYFDKRSLDMYGYDRVLGTRLYDMTRVLIFGGHHVEGGDTDGKE